MKFAFAGDRKISVKVLRFLIEQGYRPSALMVSEKARASHSEELVELADLNSKYVFTGKEFNSPENFQKLVKLDLDYIIGIHFPYIISRKVLEIPKIGFLNLHPAYLPFNKGWHTPSWAILDQTPYGATLHFMAEELDAGDIIHQKEIVALPSDTANSLYARTLELEFEVFREALPTLVSLRPSRAKQSEKGTSKSRKDLPKVQKIDLAESYTGEELINKLRALTTNSIDEAAYFVKNGKKIAIQVILKELDDLSPSTE